MATKKDPLRRQLARFIDFGDAHASFDDATARLDRTLQGKRPTGAPHSPWEQLEHIRIVQHDILEFCRNESYEELRWPDDYWPKSATPPKADSWKRSVAAFRADCDALRAIAEDPDIDLLAVVPAGDDQTYLRELLLAQDHASYHLGQLILTRKLLGAWKPEK